MEWRWTNRRLEVFQRGEFVGGAEPGGPYGDCAWLADHLQDQFVIEELGEAWPKCVRHARHPMAALRTKDGTFVWACPYNSDVSIPFGELTLPAVEEPLVANNRVRWWNDNWGWGVIAHEDGDIWAHYSVIEGDGFRSLKEEQLVEVRTVSAPQGAGFSRRAEWLSPLGNPPKNVP